MSGFKFGFDFGGDDAKNMQSEADKRAASSAAPAIEVAVPAQSAEPFGLLQDISLNTGVSIRLRRLTSHSAIQTLGNPDLAASDLVPGQYEGGLKLWESAVDLANFLLERFCSPIAGQATRLEGMRGLRVIELGCGHGLPGILCALAGAEVSFQDYNSEALTELTAPNLHMNGSLHQVALAPARFFAGAWGPLGQLLSSASLANSFDLVVSAETIYSIESMTALFECIKQCLKPGGTAYIATKTMYFGLDGGSLPFRSIVERAGGATVRQVAAVTDGVAREVLELQMAAGAA